MLKKLYIHPLTIPLFILFFLIGKGRTYSTLYFFITLHELSHLIVSILLGEKAYRFHFLPTGCMLSLSTVPSCTHHALILISGPFFNLSMYLLGIFPKENLSLALFNLIPVMPLDGGVLLNLLIPNKAIYITAAFLLITLIYSILASIPPFFPLILFLVFLSGEKNRIDKTISSKLLGQFHSK